MPFRPSALPPSHSASNPPSHPPARLLARPPARPLARTAFGQEGDETNGASVVVDGIAEAVRISMAPPTPIATPIGGTNGCTRSYANAHTNGYTDQIGRRGE